MDILLGLALLFAVLIGVILLWRRDEKRARDSRVEPLPHRRQLSREDMRETLARYCREHPALELQERHGHLVITWALPAVHATSEPPPEKTWSLELRVQDDGVVEARYGQGTVKWYHLEDGKVHRPTVEWEWDMTPDFGRRRGPAERVTDPDDHTPHTIDGLVIPLRRLARQNGYAWQPTLELPIDSTARGSA